MKLEDFVRQTLLDITKGVSTAQKESPSWIAPGYVERTKVVEPQLVSFEVVVTTSREGKGGIEIWSVVDAGAKTSAENTNRISFSVPVYFQATKDEKRKG